jgi:hypothetical protein
MSFDPTYFPYLVVIFISNLEGNEFPDYTILF